jgi:outer membrane lipoprotein-sorting protein
MIKIIRMKVFFLIFMFLVMKSENLCAQDPSALMEIIQTKLEKINDYEASASLKTQIPFLKVPDAIVKIYYKKPDKIRIKNENGISLVPKETVSISLYSLVNSHYQALDAGSDKVQGIPVRIIKLLPADENGELVLATLYIDTRRMLVLKVKTTSRENGTNEVELFYGKFVDTGLPDKIIFSFNTQDFKLPKGVTFDYDDGSVKKKETETSQNQRGKIEITYLSYSINKGIPDSLFK